MSGIESSSATDTVSGPSVELSPEAAASIQSRSMLLGLFAALTYSVANLALRGLSKTDGGTGWDMWVAGTKAFPTFAVAVFLFTNRRMRGLTTFPEWNLVWPIAIAALFNQLGGNFAFQMSLRAIGLAISVPICFSMIICSGAVMGRIILKDQVSVRTAISIALMIASIAFLSSSARSRSSGTSETVATAALSVPVGVALSMFSGICYGVTGVYIRRAVRSHMRVEATLFIFSAAGFLVLCPISLCLLPFSTITTITPKEWLTIATAGTFNAIGFYAITHAMRFLTISRANVINASQNALCAVGAVLLFGEQMSLTGIIGFTLTIAGLLALDRR